MIINLLIRKIKINLMSKNIADLDGQEAYGTWANLILVMQIKKLSPANQKAKIKELWKSDSETYLEWKNWCVDCNRLPDLFGTRDNPIHIDESKL